MTPVPEPYDRKPEPYWPQRSMCTRVDLRHYTCSQPLDEGTSAQKAKDHIVWFLRLCFGHSCGSSEACVIIFSVWFPLVQNSKVKMSWLLANISTLAAIVAIALLPLKENGRGLCPADKPPHWVVAWVPSNEHHRKPRTRTEHNKQLKVQMRPKTQIASRRFGWVVWG